MPKANTNNITQLKTPASPRDEIKEVASGLDKMESPLREVRSLVYAAQMMGSADEMPKEVGEALDDLAQTILDKVDNLVAERTRVWRLARKALETHADKR